jgi:hypothetical protein
MLIKINKKIVEFDIKDEPKTELEPPPETAAEDENIVQMHEKLERPEALVGETYKIKTPQSDHALYVTINDIVLNMGTEHEHRRPFEIFINSKNMDHFQWIVALTRIISAVFRKGGDVTFLVEELHSVFDPRGGYFKNGGRFVPSLVAEIGDVVEEHLIRIGILKPRELDQGQKDFLAAKRAEYDKIREARVETDEQQFPESATLCEKCLTKAAIYMDGCLTCLNCGESKCN